MISDTHCGHREMWVPDGDMLIHAGDFLAEWDHSEAQLSDFASWLASLPHAAKIVCAGNHDRLLDPSLDRDWRRHRATLSAVATYLDPSEPCATVFGLRVAASPVSRSRSASKNRAFQHIDAPTAAALGGVVDCSSRTRRQGCSTAAPASTRSAHWRWRCSRGCIVSATSTTRRESCATRILAALSFATRQAATGFGVRCGGRSSATCRSRRWRRGYCMPAADTCR